MEVWSSLHLSGSNAEKQHFKLSVPLLPRRAIINLIRQRLVSLWSYITQTKGEFRAVWIAICQRWKHTQDKALLYFKYDWSQFQAAGQHWPCQGAHIATLCCKSSTELPTGPRSTAALSMAGSYSTPTPAWNQDISTVISIPVNQFCVTALAAAKANAMPTAVA